MHNGIEKPLGVFCLIIVEVLYILRFMQVKLWKSQEISSLTYHMGNPVIGMTPNYHFKAWLVGVSQWSVLSIFEGTASEAVLQFGAWLTFSCLRWRKRSWEWWDWAEHWLPSLVSRLNQAVLDVLTMLTFSHLDNLLNITAISPLSAGVCIHSCLCLYGISGNS